ncbi:MAG TPA: RNA polymerase sigma factor [Polyangiaceae bacterium]|nr:RNA polymerase sigma factor [Polyangiaceae bacterium]
MKDPILDDAMDRYALGDAAAFEIVYDRLAPRLMPMLVSLTRDGALAEDIVQQTFLQMHCARETYVRGADASPWAFAIARRLAIDVFRKRRREILCEDGAADVEASGGSPEETLRARRAASSIARALAALPPGQRDAFELTKLEGLTLVESAARLGKTVLALKLGVHRASTTLRGAFSDQ